MQRRSPGNILVLCLILVSVFVVLNKIVPTAHAATLSQTSPCANGDESGLPLPSSFLPARLPAQPCNEAAESDAVVPAAGHNPDATDMQEQQILREMVSAKPATTDPKFVAFFNSITPIPLDKVKKFPGETFDHIFPQNIGTTAPDYHHETFPVSVGGDPSYADGSGTNIVRYEIPLTAFTSRNVTVTATLFYQSIPPYFLNDRFSQAPTGPATQRLYYLTSNLQTRGTAIENWKFQIATASEAATLR